MKKVQFTETVLRDANQSLIATRLGYDQFEPILDTIDKAGFYSVECWGGATFDVCLRFLNEDPWERLRKIRQKMPNTKLQMLLRGQNILGYKHYPDDIVRRFVRAEGRRRLVRFRGAGSQRKKHIIHPRNYVPRRSAAHGSKRFLLHAVYSASSVSHRKLFLPSIIPDSRRFVKAQRGKISSLSYEAFPCTMHNPLPVKSAQESKKFFMFLTSGRPDDTI